MDKMKSKRTHRKWLYAMALAALLTAVFLFISGCVKNAEEQVLSHFEIWITIPLVLLFVAFALLFVSVVMRFEEGKQINNAASLIKNILFEINPKGKNVESALSKLADFSESEAAFFAEVEGALYNYTKPELKDTLLPGKEREEFVFNLLEYMGKLRNKSTDTVFQKLIKADKKLKTDSSQLYAFMVKHGFYSIYITAVSDEQDIVSVIGVINPGKIQGIGELLQGVAEFFSVAIRNNKYLNETEKVASIDALTGLYNRLMFDFDFARKKADLRNKYTVIFIDVNELHIFNHKYGHEAGDKMLIKVSDTVCELFLGNPMYRVGGDEFLILAKNMKSDDAAERISFAKTMLSKEGYHISVGIAERKDGESLDTTLKTAENKMYEEKAEYYQKKAENTKKKTYDPDIERIETGIDELDDFLSVMCNRCCGAFCVDIDNDKFKRIIAPEFFREFSDSTGLYSKTFYNYVIGMVKSDYHRVLLGLTLYSSWEKQRENGEDLHISYEKTDGSKMSLTIYPLSETDTVWIFENI